MKLYSRKTRRSLCFLIFIVLSCYMISKTISIMKDFEGEIISRVDEVRNKSVSSIHQRAMRFIPLDIAVSNLAINLNASLNGTNHMNFSAILSKIKPSLFQAFTTIPYVSVVAYTGFDGQSFAYYVNEGYLCEKNLNVSSPSTTYNELCVHGNPYAYGNNSTFWIQGIQKEVMSTTRRLSNGSYSQQAVMQNNFFVKAPIVNRGNISIGFPKYYVLQQFGDLYFGDGYFQLATSDNEIIVPSRLLSTNIDGNGTLSVSFLNLHGDVEEEVNGFLCNMDNVNVKTKQHYFSCSTIVVSGLKMVYVLAFPTKGIISKVQQSSKVAYILLWLTMFILVVSLAIFFILIIRAAGREVVLCAALISQRVSTQQAERKSMNKTRAFNSATHDVRASLIAMKCLVEVCHQDAKPDSELANNLTQIDAVADDLKGLLNSVLDTSKIEAGKMKLEAEEFDLAKMLEDVAYIHYPLGLKKGIDVILDHRDGSIMKFNCVKGDRGKLKQILCNLLGNAIKFTSKGYVVVRTIVRKKTKESAIVASNRVNALECLSQLCFKTDGSLSSLDEVQIAQEDPNCMEFIFEVDDTGCGIPKESHNYVFEYFVQFNETPGQEGAGLGLGIVQSLVRLMGGEIRIIDKKPGEPGTLFRFNVFLTTCNNVSFDMEDNGGSSPHVLQYIGLHMRSPVHRLDGSNVILLLSSEEREKVVRRVLENFGIKVSIAKGSKDLLCILDMLIQKSDPNLSSSSDKIELGPSDHLSAFGARNLSLDDGASCNKDGYDHTLSNARRSSPKRSPLFIVIVIDAIVGPISELHNLVTSIQKETQDVWCKIVWLEDPTSRGGYSEESEKKDHPNPPFCDYILSRPLHGLLLYQVMGLLPEFNGAFQINLPKLKPTIAQDSGQSSELKAYKSTAEVFEHKNQLKEIEIPGQNNLNVLNGKSVLLVEDSQPIRVVTRQTLCKLGARVDVCKNGKEAYDLFCKLLNDQKDVQPKSLTYDYIFMDCGMPEMNGYEAVKLIRTEETKHGLRSTIFAFTAYSADAETMKHFFEETDFHVGKPLEVDKLLDVIRDVQR